MSTQKENDASVPSGMEQKEKKYTVNDVRKYVDKFFESFFSVKPSRYLKIAKDGDEWQVVAELYEDSSFIKQLGINAQVKDRNTYSVILDKQLEVLSYEKITSEM